MAVSAPSKDNIYSNAATTNGGNNRQHAIGAGVAVGLCGVLLGGPILGTVLGLGAGYAAQQDQGVVGTSARRVGTFTLRQQDRLANMEGKHHYLEKTNQFLCSVWELTVDKVNNCLLVVAPVRHEKKD
eukprot:scaffold1924_cov218-Amphora_coffeaeformis.AAC.9